MQLNTSLLGRWVLPLIAGAVLILPSCSRRDAELAATREKELESVRADLEQTKAQAAVLESDLARLRKDNQELPRLRNEVRQLRQDNQELAKQVQSARAEVQTAQATAQSAQAQAAELAEAEIQRLASAGQQAEYKDRLNAVVDAAGGLATSEGQAAAACLNNLRQIDGAKQQWALENRKSADAIPSPQDLARYIKGGMLPAGPAGGVYTLNAVNANPTCSIPGHALPPP